MAMSAPQYPLVTRVLAVLLGTWLLCGGLLLLWLAVQGGPWAAWVAFPPAFAIGYMLLQTGFTGSDPEWLYNAFDVEEHETGPEERR